MTTTKTTEASNNTATATITVLHYIY